MSVESIWANFKNTSSFVNGIITQCRDSQIGIGDVEIIDTTFADNPVQVEVTILDDGSGNMEIRPVFFGETLSGLTPVIVQFEPGSTDLVSNADLIAQQAYEEYDFGDGLSVVGDDGWDKSDPADMIKVLYVRYADRGEDSESIKVSFHVKFDTDGSIQEAYALECEHGNEIGGMPNKSSTTKPRF